MQHIRLYRVGCLVWGLLSTAGHPHVNAQTTQPPVASATAPARTPAATQAETEAKTDADYRNMLHQLGIEQLRPPVSNSAGSPDPANYDDAKVAPYTLPNPLVLADGQPVRTANVWWTQRRPQLVHLLEDSMYGRVPTGTPGVTWTVVSTAHGSDNGVETVTRKLSGHVDNTADPAVTVDIEAELTLPAHATGPIPVILALDWKPAARPADQQAGTVSSAVPTPPIRQSAREQVLARGWGYALLVPTSVQADNGAGLTSGVIGLCNRGAYRTPEQWGALRAWAWGASRLLDYFTTVPAIDAHRVGLFGHSRYGKAALVAMAFDPRFAIAYISSSGEGGAKLSRRTFGEVLENVADEREYHWMAGAFLRYAGPLAVKDLPVDAHDLLALCAPRPVFLGVGALNGDGWADAEGEFDAAVAAGPVYRLLGQPDLGTTVFPPPGNEIGSGPLVFRQHSEGHTPAPNWPFFLDFAGRELKTTTNGHPAI